MKKFRVIAMLSGVFLAVSVPTGAAQKGAAKQPPMTPALNIGKMNYDVKCASCHGPGGVGTDKGPTFLHRVYHPGHHADGSFYLAAKRGARAHHWKFGDMPPVEGITDKQIEKIVLYIRAVQKTNGLF